MSFITMSIGVAGTEGSMMMFNPLISLKYRSTNRRSVPEKSREIGLPVYLFSPELSVRLLVCGLTETGTGAGASAGRCMDRDADGVAGVCRRSGAAAATDAAGACAGAAFGAA